MYPSMDQNYITTHVQAVVAEPWEWKETLGREEREGREKEELRVGKDGWRYEPKGKGY